MNPLDLVAELLVWVQAIVQFGLGVAAASLPAVLGLLWAGLSLHAGFARRPQAERR